VGPLAAPVCGARCRFSGRVQLAQARLGLGQSSSVAGDGGLARDCARLGRVDGGYPCVSGGVVHCYFDDQKEEDDKQHCPDRGVSSQSIQIEPVSEAGHQSPRHSFRVRQRSGGPPRAEIVNPPENGERLWPITGSPVESKSDTRPSA